MTYTTRRLAAVVLGLAALATACGGSDDPAYRTLDGKAPLVIGHRGASGLLPEHTLEAYRLAIEQGADFIEPDLVMTRDGVLVARHEPMLDGTTDATRPQQYNGQYRIPTFDEVIALARSESTRTGRSVGVYPEIKHSTFMAGVFGANRIEDAVLATLHAAYGNRADAPVFIQSFEVSNLQYLRTKTSLKLVQLVDANDVNDDGSMQLVAPYRQPYDFVVKGDPRLNSDLLTAAGLDFVKTYANAIGPWKPYLVKTVADGVDRNGDGRITINDRRVDGSTGLIELAHARGLAVHTWTFRNDSSGYGFTDPQAEMAYYLRLGLDGAFTDFPATGVAAVRSLN